ncbi:nucleotidyltransferase family protein [Pseudomonadota bacterium]|nr:nucleotidyltransferase family protein [Pseudomonadota bacterium]
MKVIILSAGRGDRLRPLTDHTPKPLLKAGDKRLIEYTIHSLVTAGFTDIVINTAYLSEQFPIALGNGEAYGATISYTTEGINGLETAGGIINALPLLGDEPFLVVNGDIWTDFPFEQLHALTLAPSKLGHLVFVNNPVHNPNGDFSLLSGNVVDGGENKVTYSGIAVFHPDLFKLYDVQKMALKPVLLTAISKRQLSGRLYEGQWSDIGTAARLEELIRYIEN